MKNCMSSAAMAEHPDEFKLSPHQRLHSRRPQRSAQFPAPDSAIHPESYVTSRSLTIHAARFGGLRAMMMLTTHA